MRGRWIHVAVCGALFLFALALRLHFFCGFVLGDDPVEFAALISINRHGPTWTDQLHVRFGGWVLNVAALRLFGVSESTLFLPTWLVSAAIPVVAYALLVTCGYGAGAAALAGAFVATAPFEILMGAVRSNDLFLALSVALGCLVLLRYSGRPVLQGVLLALLFWFGFYVKLWVVYFLPPLAVYYLRCRAWRAAGSFVLASTILHGATVLFWKSRLGEFFPFLTHYAATYPIPWADVPRLLLDYPRLVFVGSDLGTTLFGVVPYVLVALLVLKIVARWLPPSMRSGDVADFGRWDRLDVLLVTVYAVFLVLLDLVPNSFKFDQYYSAPRIFRYLVPLSFAVTLHTAKMLLDLTAALLPRPRWLPVAIFLVLAIMNITQADTATRPARDFRRTFLAMRDEIERVGPPMVVAESVIAEWLKNLYLVNSKTRVMTAYHTYPARAYEGWLAKTQGQLPDGTMLITGLSGYVFYGAQQDGFRLRLFAHPLSPEWTIFKNYGFMSHLPDPAIMWRLSQAGAGSAPEAPPEEPALPVTGDTADSLFKNGMTHFDANEYPAARAHFKAIIDRFPNTAEADDARYFYAVAFFREARWSEAKAAFQSLIATNPNGRWAAAGYFHLGRCDLELQQPEEARAALQYVLDHFSYDVNSANQAREALRSVPGAERGLVGEFADTVRGWFRR
jgi:hypothetical protein